MAVGVLVVARSVDHTTAVDILSGADSAPVTSAGAAALPPRHGRVAARLARAVENALSEIGLSLPQYRMLIFLDEGGSAAASALAGNLGVSRPSVTALVDGLVARGLAERSTDLIDRRRVAHMVTPLGLDLLAKADEIVEARLIELAGAIDDDAGRAEAFAGLEQWQVAMNTEREAKLKDQ